MPTRRTLHATPAPSSKRRKCDEETTKVTYVAITPFSPKKTAPLAPLGVSVRGLRKRSSVVSVPYLQQVSPIASNKPIPVAPPPLPLKQQGWPAEPQPETNRNFRNIRKSRALAGCKALGIEGCDEKKQDELAQIFYHKQCELLIRDPCQLVDSIAYEDILLSKEEILRVCKLRDFATTKTTRGKTKTLLKKELYEQFAAAIRIS